jgi:alpha-galactosidase
MSPLHRAFRISCCGFFLMAVALPILRAADAPPSDPISLGAFKSDSPPFSFNYDGKDSVATKFLSTWQRDEKVLPSEGGELHRFTFTDPATHLKVTAEVRTFTDYKAIEWVLYFANEGTGDTPILDNIQALNWPNALLTEKDRANRTVLHGARGSQGGPQDYEPITRTINGGDGVRSNGCSSTDYLPFFNLQAGDHGVIEAIGWSASWQAGSVPNRENTAVNLTAGMQKTHLLLHAGETIRSPRILLLPWHGDYLDSQNLWRRLALAYYTPRDIQNKRINVPITYGSWGAEPVADKIAKMTKVHDLKIPVEVYWMDAGWYGNEDKGGWTGNRGNWDPDPKFYPNGLKPLGDALKQMGYGFLLWMAPEQALQGSTIQVQHPDWFLPPNQNNMCLLKLVDPNVTKGITDYVTKIMQDAGATCFRQDFDLNPGGPPEAPDRIGMNDIQYVTNFYAFWDGLRKNIPGFQIDNCDSGGKRLDLETMMRSYSLWRSDSMVNGFDPSMQQMQTQGMIPWWPMSGGISFIDDKLEPGSAKELYQQRTAYCAGTQAGGRMEAMNGQLAEYHEVQPYFYGDFYPLIAYSPSLDAWAVWQLDRPDLKSGVVILLRRQESPYTTLNLPLHAIDLAAPYQVEIRNGAAKGELKQMSGKDLIGLQVVIPDEPGSALVFYKKL